jgi:hypothetical protein
MKPFSIGLSIEEKYMEILVQEFDINQSPRFQCTVGNSIIFWVERNQEGKWRQTDGSTSVLVQTIGEKIQQFKGRTLNSL